MISRRTQMLSVHVPRARSSSRTPGGVADQALLVYFPALHGPQHYWELYEPESFSSMEPEVYQFPVVRYVYPKLHPPCLCYLHSACYICVWTLSSRRHVTAQGGTPHTWHVLRSREQVLHLKGLLLLRGRQTCSHLHKEVRNLLPFGLVDQ